MRKLAPKPTYKLLSLDYLRQKLSFSIASLSYLLIFLLPVASTLLLPKIALADSPYLASDVLGQTDANGDPDFDTSYPDNWPAPNDIGFNSVNDSVIDTVGHRLFVSDYSNHRIMIFNLETDNTLTDHTADNVLGAPNFTDTGADLNAKGFSQQYGLAIDPTTQRLFVSDRDHNRVLVFDVTAITDNEDAVNVLGQADFTTGTSDINAKGFSSPGGLGLNSDTQMLYVSDSNNHRVLVFDITAIIDNEDAVNVLGQADFTSAGFDTTAKGFRNPIDAAVDPDGQKLYVTDATNDRVLVFDISTITNNEDAVNVLGQANFTTGTNDTNAKGFFNPAGVSVNVDTQQLFVADVANHRVLVFDISTIADNEDAAKVLGAGDFTSTGFDNGVGDPEGFNGAIGVDADPTTNRLYVSDQGNNRILVFDTSVITNNESAVDVIGQLDRNDEISFTQVSSNSNPRSYEGGFTSPISSALDAIHHRLFVSDTLNCRVLIFNLDNSNNLEDYLADAVLGDTDFTLDPDACSETDINSFNYPGGLAYDDNHNYLYVENEDSGRILVFDVASTTNGEDAVFVLGHDDFDDNNTGISQSELGFGRGGLAFDSTRNLLYVPDINSNCRVMVFDVNSITNGENAVKVLGQPDFDTANCETDINSLNSGFSGGLTIDSANQRLFVADPGNARVMVFDVNSITNGENAVKVLGQPDFDSSFCCSIDQHEVGASTALVYDAGPKRLFVSDHSNQRLMVFDVEAITNNEDAVAVIGQDGFDNINNTSPSQTGFAITDYSVNMAWDASNRRTYLADNLNNRVLIFDFVNITNTALNNGQKGVAYADTIDESGDQGTVSFAKTAGTLPPGVTLSTTTGTLTGVPTTAGTYNFTITVSDNNGNAGTFQDKQAYTVTIANTGGSGGGGSSGGGSGSSGSSGSSSDSTGDGTFFAQGTNGDTMTADTNDEDTTGEDDGESTDDENTTDPTNDPASFNQDQNQEDEDDDLSWWWWVLPIIPLAIAGIYAIRKRGGGNTPTSSFGGSSGSTGTPSAPSAPNFSETYQPNTQPTPQVSTNNIFYPEKQI